jgi:hypothetical protein
MYTADLMRAIPYKKFSFLLVSVLFLSLPLQASMVLPLTLQKMAVMANRVFEGECIGMEEDVDENSLPVTYVTFAVNQVFKGSLDSTVTIKQYGMKPREDTLTTLLGIGPHIIGAMKGLARPSFREGEKVILFLYPDSQWGFTSPIGLGQGKFVVDETLEGEKIVSNSFLNMFTDISNLSTLATLAPHSSQALSAQSLAIQIPQSNYDRFIDVVRDLPTMETP